MLVAADANGLAAVALERAATVPVPLPWDRTASPELVTAEAKTVAAELTAIAQAADEAAVAAATAAEGVDPAAKLVVLAFDRARRRTEHEVLITRYLLVAELPTVTPISATGERVLPHLDPADATADTRLVWELALLAPALPDPPRPPIEHYQRTALAALSRIADERSLPALTVFGQRLCRSGYGRGVLKRELKPVVDALITMAPSPMGLSALLEVMTAAEAAAGGDDADLVRAYTANRLKRQPAWLAVLAAVDPEAAPQPLRTWLTDLKTEAAGAP